MATVDLQVSSVISATGWTGASQANLSSSNDVRATGGDAGVPDFIHCELDDVPGDFSSLNSVTLHVEGRKSSTAGRPKQFLVELYDSGDTLLETFTTGDLTTADVLYSSAALTRSDSAAVINGYRLRVTCLEGGGMPSSTTQEVDHMYVTLDYNAGGTEFTQNVSGGVTPSGDPVRDTQKGLAGAATPAGAQVRETQKLAAGAVTPAGVQTRSTLKTTTGAVTPTGALGLSLLFLTSIAGSVTPSSTMVRGVLKAIGGSVAATGTTVKDTFKQFAGSVGVSGGVAKTTNKSPSGGVTPSGSTSTIFLVQQLMAGALSPVGTMVRFVTKFFAGSVQPSATLTKDTDKTVAGSVQPAATLTKDIDKTVAGTVSPSGTTTTGGVFTKIVSGVVSIAGSLGSTFLPGGGGGGPVGRIYRRLMGLGRGLGRKR